MKNMTTDDINKNPSGEQASTPEPKEASPKVESDVDYKAELEKVRSQLAQAEHTIIKEKAKNKSVQSQAKEDDDEEDEPLPIAHIQEQIQKEVGKIEQRLFQREIEKELESNSSSKEEQDLIKFHYENTIKQTGDFKTDIKNAKILANRAVIENRINEVKRAVGAKSTMSGGSTTGQDINDEPTIALNPLEESILKRRGLTAKDVKQN